MFGRRAEKSFKEKVNAHIGEGEDKELVDGRKDIEIVTRGVWEEK